MFCDIITLNPVSPRTPPPIPLNFVLSPAPLTQSISWSYCFCLKHSGSGRKVPGRSYSHLDHVFFPLLNIFSWFPIVSRLKPPVLTMTNGGRLHLFNFPSLPRAPCLSLKYDKLIPTPVPWPLLFLRLLVLSYQTLILPGSALFRSQPT